MSHPSPRLTIAATPLLTTLLLAACASRQTWHTASPGAIASDSIRAEYDADTDTTWVRTPPMPLGGGLDLYASFRFPGDVLSRPPAEVRLVFQQMSAGPRWHSASGRTLVLWLDDTARVAVDSTSYQRDVRAGRGPVTARVMEWVWAGIPTDDFRRLAGASKIEGTIASTHFTLRPEQIATLRELARLLEPRG